MPDHMKIIRGLEGDIAAPTARPTPKSIAPPDAAFDIRVACTEFQLAAANRLVRRMYAWRGYTLQSGGWLRHHPQRLTLNVWAHHDVAATLTVVCDSADGLSAERLYAEEIAPLRAEGKVLCEVTRLAIHPQTGSAEILDKLFRTALGAGWACFRATDVLIEVNPRHVRFYEQRCGFRQIGRQRQCPRVNAPAVLLHQTRAGLVACGYVPDTTQALAEALAGRRELLARTA